MTIPAILVCDEGPGVGLGHRRRCEAIAGELRRVGFSPAIVTAGPPEELAHLLRTLHGESCVSF